MNRFTSMRRRITGVRGSRAGVFLGATLVAVALAGPPLILSARSSAAVTTAAPVQLPRSTPSPTVTLSPAVPSSLNDVSPAGLDSYIRTHMRTAHVPGLAACVIYNGDIVWAKGYGWANIAHHRKVTPDTDFMLASISKTVIATAVMQQVEGGGIALDANVNAYLPFRVRNPSYPRRAITPFMLLTHTSSIRDYWPTLVASYVDGDSPIPLSRFVKGYLVRGGRWWDRRDFYPFAPAHAYRYSNMGATLAAYLVQAVTGKHFDDYCDAYIFGPLGMNATAWHLRDLKRSQVAMPYRYVRATGRYRPYGQYGYPDYPDGQLRTSVSQLGRFLALYMAGGTYQGVQLLQPATVTQILTPQARNLVRGQGLIWYHWKVAGWKVVGHNGGDSGVATNMYFDPVSGAGAIVLTNGDAWRSSEWRALDQVFGKLMEEAPDF